MPFIFSTETPHGHIYYMDSKGNEVTALKALEDAFDGTPDLAELECERRADLWSRRYDVHIRKTCALFIK